MIEEPHSRSRFVQSVVYALRGLRYTVVSQRNMVIHVVVSGGAIFLGLWLQLSRFEWMYLWATITLVLVTETVNTAIEITIDLVTRKRKYRAMLSKDVAAGAVLLTASHAVIAGYILFFDKLLLKFV